MTQEFIDSVRDAWIKGAYALKAQIRQFCDHKMPNGKSAIKGVPDFAYCDICGKSDL